MPDFLKLVVLHKRIVRLDHSLICKDNSGVSIGWYLVRFCIGLLYQIFRGKFLGKFKCETEVGAQRVRGDG